MFQFLRWEDDGLDDAHDGQTTSIFHSARLTPRRAARFFALMPYRTHAECPDERVTRQVDFSAASWFWRLQMIQADRARCYLPRRVIISLDSAD